MQERAAGASSLVCTDLYGNKNVVEEDIRDVSTKICRSCCWHDGTLKHQKYTYRKCEKFHLHSPLQQANEHFSSFFESIIYSLLFAAFCFHLNSSMRNKTGTPRFLGKWSPLSQSLSGRSPADQKARGLWVRDWLTNKTPSSKSRHGKVR